MEIAELSDSSQSYVSRTAKNVYLKLELLLKEPQELTSEEKIILKQVKARQYPNILNDKDWIRFIKAKQKQRSNEITKSC